MSQQVEILIVEDEVIIAKSLEKTLNILGYEHVDRTRKVEEAEDLIKTEKYGLVILDINLNVGYEGLVLGELCKKLDVPFFFLTSYGDQNTFRQAKAAKPGSYVIKPFDQKDIMVAVELTLMNSPNEISQKVDVASELYGLSKRERDILVYAYENMPNSEIGARLSLSTNTVKYHLKNIYTKIGSSSKTEIIERVDTVWTSTLK